MKLFQMESMDILDYVDQSSQPFDSCDPHAVTTHVGMMDSLGDHAYPDQHGHVLNKPPNMTLSSANSTNRLNVQDLLPPASPNETFEYYPRKMY